jgi:hypothetical protein
VNPGTNLMGMSKEEWKKIKRRASIMILLFLAYSVLLNVSGEDMENELWDKLGSLYQSYSMVKKLFT